MQCGIVFDGSTVFYINNRYIYFMKRLTYTVQHFRRYIRLKENFHNQAVTEAHFFKDQAAIDRYINQFGLKQCSEQLPNFILFVYLNTFQSLEHQKHKYAGTWLPMTPTHHFQTSKQYFLKEILPTFHAKVVA